MLCDFCAWLTPMRASLPDLSLHRDAQTVGDLHQYESLFLSLVTVMMHKFKLWVAYTNAILNPPLS